MGELCKGGIGQSKQHLSYTKKEKSQKKLLRPALSKSHFENNEQFPNEINDRKKLSILHYKRTKHLRKKDMMVADELFVKIQESSFHKSMTKCRSSGLTRKPYMDHANLQPATCSANVSE